MTQKERYERALAYFEQSMPTAQSELHFDNPYQLIVAVILSAQCTDKRVNMVTPALFETYPTAESMAQATPDEVLRLISSVSYPNSKSRHLVGMAQKLVSDFGGVVPDDIEQLQTLPGVGRKTANVVLAVAYGKPALAVDTHVFRVANRIGLTKDSKNPLQTEQELVKHIPVEKIPIAHHWLILHGRYVCQARKPHCGECGVADICQWHKRAMAAETRHSKTDKGKDNPC